MTSFFTFLQKPLVRWLMAIGWSLWIGILLVQSESNPLIDIGIQSGPRTLIRDILAAGAHLLAFGTACGLWFWAWSGYLRLLPSLALACCIAICLGGLTEYLQTFSPGRHPSWVDFIANCAGIFIVACFIWYTQADHQHFHSAAPRAQKR